MQIGEFAKRCHTKISVLRHYDKEGLLKPDFVDVFTGYRYYTEEQIVVFGRISALKAAGFSLGEIKNILEHWQSNENVLVLFEKKKQELQQQLKKLTQMHQKVVRDRLPEFHLIRDGKRLYALSAPVQQGMLTGAREQLDQALLSERYQRISAYALKEEPDGTVRLRCEMVSFRNEPAPMQDPLPTTFEDDPDVVGKWAIVGEYVVREDFYKDVCRKDFAPGKQVREIYFLPYGEPYWCYRWTRGKLICSFFHRRSVNAYQVEEIDGTRYMFVDFKSYRYGLSGHTTVLVLQQIDHEPYSRAEIAKQDNINIPFVNDPRVVGKWTAYDFTATKDGYMPPSLAWDQCAYAAIHFMSDGNVHSYYHRGEAIIQEQSKQTWTRGYVLWHAFSLACEYEIRVIEGREYLFLQWKSGDYVYGGMDPAYYVFVRGREEHDA